MAKTDGSDGSDGSLGDSWISSSTVIKKLTANGANPVEMEEMLAAYLRNGDLRARAKSIWLSDERFTSQARPLALPFPQHERPFAILAAQLGDNGEDRAVELGAVIVREFGQTSLHDEAA